jgi:hypothetical protein
MFRSATARQTATACRLASVGAIEPLFLLSLCRKMFVRSSAMSLRILPVRVIKQATTYAKFSGKSIVCSTEFVRLTIHQPGILSALD